jgi:hypothetical protein
MERNNINTDISDCIFKLVRSPGIDSMESIPPAYSYSVPPQIVLKLQPGGSEGGLSSPYLIDPYNKVKSK